MAMQSIKNRALKIAIFGIHQQGLEIADYLIKNNIKISLFVTITHDLAGINKAAGWVSYENFASINNIPIYYANSYSLKSDSDFAYFASENIDLVILGGWQRLIPSQILAQINIMAIGQHGSSENLPRGRGRSPLSWSLIDDRKRLIWNLFKIQPGIDDGPIISKQMFEITPWDDIKTLYYKVSIAVQKMTLELINNIICGEEIKEQAQLGSPTFYRKIEPADRLINWEDSVFKICRSIKASTRPYPGAYVELEGSHYSIWKAQVFDTILDYPGASIGQIVEIFNQHHFLVCGVDGLILITDSEITPALGTIL